jgi:hypothetical protein
MAKIKKSSKSSPMMDQDRQWQIDSAMSTVLRYNDLLKDKTLMKDVQKKAQEQLNTVNTNFKFGGTVKKAAPKKAIVAKKSVVKKAVVKKKK